MSTVKLLTSVDGAPAGALLHRDLVYVTRLVDEGKATWDLSNGFDWPKASDISAFGPYASVAQLEAAYPAALYPNGIGQVSANGATTTHIVSNGKWSAVVGADFNPLTGRISLFSAGAGINDTPLATAPTYGAELVQFGDFSSATGWTAGTGWVISGGVATLTSDVGVLSTQVSVVSGKTYQVSWALVSGSPTFNVALGSVTPTQRFSWDSKIITFVANSTGLVTLSFVPTATASCVLDNISCKQVLTSGGVVASYATDYMGVVTNELRAFNASLKCFASGVQALQQNTTGYSNSATGFQALQQNTTGYSNSATGFQALQQNTTGNSNSALGTASGVNLGTKTTAGAFIVGVNYTIMSAGTTDFTSIGASNNTVGTTFTATGVGAGTGTAGPNAMQCTMIGKDAGRYKQDGTNLVEYSSVTCIGYNSRAAASNEVQIGGSGVTVYAASAITTRSDRRDKADIRPTVLGLSFIDALRPVDYRFDMRDDYFDTVVDEDGNETLVPIVKDGSRKRTRYHHGVIAQDIQALVAESGVDFGGLKDASKSVGGCDVLSISYEEFVAPLIKAVQELSARVKELEAKG